MGLINPVPRKTSAMSGVRTSAPRYAPMVPSNANSMLPRKKSAKGITATAGGTAARRMKPFLKTGL